MKKILSIVVIAVLGLISVKSPNLANHLQHGNYVAAIEDIKGLVKPSDTEKTQVKSTSVNSSNPVSGTLKGDYFSLKPSNLNKMCDYQLERDAYMSCFSSKYKIPLLVAYKLEKNRVEKSLKRPSGFKVDKQLRKMDQRNTYDYSHSGGYDRGHMMPNAAADWSKKAQNETFLISNVVPQASKFNQGAWRLLEEHARHEASKNKYVYIITGVIPGNRIMKKGINIPKQMYKIITYPNGRSVAYLYPNNKSVLLRSWNNKKYKTTLKNIEKLSGFDF